MKKKFKLNSDLKTPSGKHFAGSIIEIECDGEGVALDRFWRSRIKDSEIDNCLSSDFSEKVLKTKSKK